MTEGILAYDLWVPPWPREWPRYSPLRNPYPLSTYDPDAEWLDRWLWVEGLRLKWRLV